MSPTGILKCLNFGAVLYTIAAYILIGVFTLFVALPEISKDVPALYWERMIWSSFLIFSLVANLCYIRRKRSFFHDANITPVASTRWQRCLDCNNQPVPPRAHHCVLCKKCILRRDHHCYFTFSCIGFENQRYFIVYVFYCSVSCLYALYLISCYIQKAYSDMYSMTYVDYILPITVIEWTLGYLEFQPFMAIFIAYLCAITGFSSVGIFLWQSYMVLLGTTTHEYSSNVWTYRKDIQTNIYTVFGACWPLHFLVPLPCVRVPGDGIMWRVEKHV